MLASKPCSTPISKDIKILYESDIPRQNPDSYCQLIGKLLYLTNTRHDINFVIYLLSQFIQTPIAHHYQAA